VDFIPHTQEDWNQMLGAIGVKSFQELLSKIIPSEVKKCDYRLDGGLSELEVLNLMKAKAELNANADSYDTFLGAGAYDHFIPSLVSQLASRGEFSTAYTPYQPEASQGTLQAIFEYQTMIARLTGMEVSNASLYDGASALAEAALMTMAIRGDHGRILVSETVHPEYRDTIKTYLRAKAEEIIEIPRKNASTDLEKLEDQLKRGATALLIQWPNFFGCLEDLEILGKMAHQYGACGRHLSCRPRTLKRSG
jgi:glycine dehydrogenase subunit 1